MTLESGIIVYTNLDQGGPECVTTEIIRGPSDINILCRVLSDIRKHPAKDVDILLCSNTFLTSLVQVVICFVP